jgi:hypothetical protein
MEIIVNDIGMMVEYERNQDLLQYEFWKPPQLKQSNINSSIYVVCKIHIYEISQKY